MSAEVHGIDAVAVPVESFRQRGVAAAVFDEAVDHHHDAGDGRRVRQPALPIKAQAVRGGETFFVVRHRRGAEIRGKKTGVLATSHEEYSTQRR